MTGSALKERRIALGITRAQLSAYAYVDPRISQLVELGHHQDPVVLDRLDRTLAALEAGQAPPDWKADVDAAIDAEGADKLHADKQE